MTDAHWNQYFEKQLAAAEKELANFKQAMTQYGLRVFHRDLSGERDVTDQELKCLEEQIDEYRRALRED